MNTKIYKSAKAKREAATEYYKAKVGPEYRSHEERRVSRRALSVRKDSDRLAKDVQTAFEAAYGVRQCSACETALPLDATHYRPSAVSRLDLNTKCRACVTGYASWEARAAVQRARKSATAARRLAKQIAREERQRISAIKSGAPYKAAMYMKNKSNEMTPLYVELARACERAIEHNRDVAWLGDMIVEIATDHGRCVFLELNSSAYRVILSGDFEKLDPVAMRDAWLGHAERWEEKRVEAERTVSELLDGAQAL